MHGESLFKRGRCGGGRSVLREGQTRNWQPSTHPSDSTEPPRRRCPPQRRSGPESGTRRAGPVMVSALVVVNALGDVLDPHTGKIVAGARKAKDSHEFADSAAAMMQGTTAGFTRSNTTLAVVATNAKLSKTGATKFAQLA